MNLDAKEVFKFSKILYFVRFVEVYLEILDAGRIFSEDDEIIPTMMTSVSVLM